MRAIAWALPIILAAFVLYATASAIDGEPETAYPLIHEAPIAPAVATTAAAPQPAAETTAATKQPDYLLMFLALIFGMTGLMAMTVIHAVTSK